jgi:hypothetical protein
MGGSDYRHGSSSTGLRNASDGRLPLTHKSSNPFALSLSKGNLL